MSQSPQQSPENHQKLGEVWWFCLCQSWSPLWELAGGHYPQDLIVGRYRYKVYTMQSMHHRAEAPYRMDVQGGKSHPQSSSHDYFLGQSFPCALSNQHELSLLQFVRIYQKKQMMDLHLLRQQLPHLSNY